jgi:hypothetical protein
MAGCDATDKVKALLRKMAAAKIEEGHTDPETILSHIHDAIADHTPLHRGEIADIITGHGGQKATKTDLQNRVAQFYKELRDLRATQDKLGPRPPEAVNRDPARAKAIETKMAEVQRQMDYGNDVPEAGSAKEDSPRIAALKAQLADLRQQHANLEPSPPATRPLDPNITRNKALKTSLENRIADLQSKIAEGDTTDQGKFQMTRDARNKELQSQLDSLTAEWNAMHDPGEESKTQDRLKSDIARLDTKIAAGDKGTARVQGPDSEAVTALKAERKAKNALLNSMKERPVNTVDPNLMKNAARQRVIEKSIKAYEDRMARGDYSPNPPRADLLQTDATQKAQARLNTVRAEFEKNRRQTERANRSDAVKVADMIVELHRTAALMSPNILLKLPATALSNIAIRPALLEPVGQGLRRMLPGIAEKARSEGQAAGYFGPEGGALKKTFSRETLQAMKDITKTGTHELKSLYGDQKRDQDLDSDFKLTQFVGNLHGALKTPAAINHWSRVMPHIMEAEAKAARKSGMSEQQVAEHMNNPATKAKVGAEAWVEAEREIFQNPNWLSDLHSRLLGGLEAAEKAGGLSAVPAGIASRVVRYALPITKVPVNVAISASSYVGGLVGALTHMAVAARKGGEESIWQNAVNNLTPEQANSVMRNLKKQTVGAAALAIGAYLYKNFGGMYQQGDSKNKQKPDSETIRGELFGHKFNISKQVLEHPLLTAMQIGATVMWVAHKPKSDVGDAVKAAAGGLAERIPQVRLIGDLSNAASRKSGWTKFAGQQVSSMNPQLVQWAARHADQSQPIVTDNPFETTANFLGGKLTKRTPKDAPGRALLFLQEIETGIPGLRKNVPRSPNQ